MRLYEIQKIEHPTGRILFSSNATELGLVRMGARIANGGTSDGSSPLGYRITARLALGESVEDPIRSDIRWSARCLGGDFKYCSGLLFPTPAQMARYMERR